MIGHRNWIVVTDMAYPLQTNQGIMTLYAPESYDKIVGEVNHIIKEAPHFFAHVYLDKEQESLNEQLAPG